MQPDDFQKLFDVSRESMARLAAYHALLLKWQKAINLVSPGTLETAWQRHFADSAQLSQFIPSSRPEASRSEAGVEGSPCSSAKEGRSLDFARDEDRGGRDDGVFRVADLGSGAGFPGLVLALLRPDLDVHLIESDERKAQFLKTVSRETGTAVTIHNARIEDVLPSIAPDVITARAFASLADILQICAPVLAQNTGLQMVLLKGQKAGEEIVAARQKFSFELASHSSQTDPMAQILVLKDIAILSSWDPSLRSG